MLTLEIMYYHYYQISVKMFFQRRNWSLSRSQSCAETYI